MLISLNWPLLGLEQGLEHTKLLLFLYFSKFPERLTSVGKKKKMVRETSFELPTYFLLNLRMFRNSSILNHVPFWFVTLKTVLFVSTPRSIRTSDRELWEAVALKIIADNRNTLQMRLRWLTAEMFNFFVVSSVPPDNILISLFYLECLNSSKLHF